MSDLIAKMTASVVIIEDGRCLVLEEIEDDGTRKFNLPGGHVELGETLLEAAIREVKEETGYDVQIGDLLAVQELCWKTHHTAKYIFYGRRLGGALSLEPGVVAHWMNRGEVDAISEDRWVRNMNEVLRCGLDGYKIDARAVMLYDEGKRVRWG